MSFEEMIECSQELLQRKVPRQGEDLSWDLHLRRYEPYLHAEEKWTAYGRIIPEPMSRMFPVGQTLPDKEVEAKSAVKALWWELCGLPTVESVSIEKLSDDVFNVTTIITNLNLEVERKVAQAEVDLMNKYRDLRFDFRIIPRRGRKLTDLLPNGGEVLYSKHKRD